MAFVQLMEFKTSDPKGVEQLFDEWSAATTAAERSVMTKHRDEPDRYCALVHFPSYEAAMANSERAETHQYAQRLREKVDGDITYSDLDIIEEKVP